MAGAGRSPPFAGAFMASIQLALSNETLADSLRSLLSRSTEFPVRCVDVPDVDEAGVVVMDSAHLQGLGRPLPHPERIVLISAQQPSELKSAWDAGVNSVVYEADPLNTVVLAILSACLRVSKPKRTAG